MLDDMQIPALKAFCHVHIEDEVDMYYMVDANE